MKDKTMCKFNSGILRKPWLYLAVITFLAIVIRSWPAWVNPAWGCDFGIYYGLTKSFVETGRLFNDYTGWGVSYQYFPMLYVVTGMIHWITGLDIIVIMPKVAPIFGGLSVLIFYFIARMILDDERRALIASLFLAVLPFHVYQTSHAAPLTFGHFFMMLSIYFFMRYRQDSKYVIPLIISTVLLIMSHHLTTFFYLLSLIGIVIMENSRSLVWISTIKRDILSIILTSIVAFTYWMAIARDVYVHFMGRGIKVGSYTLGATATVILFYLVLFLLLFFVWLKRKYRIYRHVEEPTSRSSLIRFSVSFSICLGSMIVFSFVKMPWTNFRFTSISILYSIPLICM
ncbi:MAG: hypothetical protein QXS02_02870, partial [Candidatus Thermoplasmatota archaeon]